MKISTKGRYALRIMIDLAEHNTGEYIRLKDISKRQGDYTENIWSRSCRFSRNQDNVKELSWK